MPAKNALILHGLFEHPFDFPAIKQHAHRFVFMHSDNDPYCPLRYAQELAPLVGGELVVLPGKEHFSADSTVPVTALPELLEIIK